MTIKKAIFLGWLFFFSSQSFLKAESLFFSAGNDLGGILVNRRPFGQTWFEPNTNTSSKIGPEIFHQGENLIELVLLVTKEGGSYTFQFEGLTDEKLYDARIVTSWHDPVNQDEKEVKEITIEWKEPSMETMRFPIKEAQQLIVSLEKDDNEKLVATPEYQEVKLNNRSLVSQVIIKVPYYSVKGAPVAPPWMDSVRYQKEDFIEVEKIVNQYAKLLVGKNIKGLEVLCDELWRWQAACRGETFEQRREAVRRASERHRNLEIAKIELTKIDVFPLSPIIRISGNQIGLSLDGKPIYLEMKLFKKDDHWKIGL